MNVTLRNHMSRKFTLHLATKVAGLMQISKVVVGPGEFSKPIPKDAFDEAVEGNNALQAYLDSGRLSTTEGQDTEKAEVKTDQSGDAEKPENLKNTRKATTGKVEHEAKTETVEIKIPEQTPAAGSDAPKGGKKAG